MTKEQELKELAQECIVLLKRQIALLEEMGVETVERTSKITRPSIKAKVDAPNSLKYFMNKMGAK